MGGHARAFRQSAEAATTAERRRKLDANSDRTCNHFSSSGIDEDEQFWDSIISLQAFDFDITEF